MEELLWASTYMGISANGNIRGAITALCHILLRWKDCLSTASCFNTVGTLSESRNRDGYKHSSFGSLSRARSRFELAGGMLFRPHSW